MKTLTSLTCTAALGLAFAIPAMADDQSTPAPAPSTPAAGTPAMSEIPKMKEQGERMAVLRKADQGNRPGRAQAHHGRGNLSAIRQALSGRLACLPF